eukprot:jgi/Bigna1/86702/estExt_fgenesh1_pg.C_130002
MKHLFFVLATLLGGILAGEDCKTFKDCTSCASAKSWTGNNCRWCPKTNDCHAEGSVLNKCSQAEQITNKDRCPIPVAQIHIAFAGRNENGDSNGMTISWATFQKTQTSTVMYGTDKSSLDTKATGEQKQYLENATFHHHVTLSNLKAGTTYFYKCGDDATVGYSSIYNFTSPKSSTPEFGFKVSVFGDWGYGQNGKALSTRKALQDIVHDVDFVWHAGDIGYADDAFLHDPASFQYENVYDGYMQWISNMTNNKPYMVAAGNHESECHSPICLADSKKRKDLSNFTAYNTRFKMPFESSGATSNMWYSFNYGLAHFVVVDTETDFKGAGEENKGDSGILPAGHFGTQGEYLKWLENDLAKAADERDVRPWIFAAGHRPIYSDKIHTELQAAMEEVFHKYKVDIYFSGHEHSYTRTFPVYKGDVQKNYSSPSYTAHVTVGGAGCDEMTPEGPDGYNTSAAWIAKHDHHFGTGILEVFNSSAVKWTYLLSDDLSVEDYFVLTK